MRHQGEQGGEGFDGAGDLHLRSRAEDQVMLDCHARSSQGKNVGRVLTAGISHNKGTDGGIFQKIFCLKS